MATQRYFVVNGGYIVGGPYVWDGVSPFQAAEFGALLPEYLAQGLSRAPSQGGSVSSVAGLSGTVTAAGLNGVGMELAAGAQAKVDAHAATTAGVHGILAIEDLLRPSQLVPSRLGAATVLEQFQAGHGWSAAVGSGADDTTDFALGSQSYKLTTNGAGGTCTASKTGYAAFDTTAKLLRIVCKLSDSTLNAGLNIYLGASGTNFATGWKWFVQGSNPTGTSSMVLTSGDWVTITLGWVDAQAQGSPGRSMTDIKFTVADTAGTPLVLGMQEIALVPDGTSTFPKGVVSICFDDSWQSVWDHARPRLNLYGYAASMYTIQDTVGTAGRVTAAELLTLQEQTGWEIAGHAYLDADHATRYPPMAAAGTLDADLRNMKQWLVNQGFRGADGTASPGGQYDEPTLKVLRRYFGYHRTTVSRTKETFPPGDRYRLRAISTVGPSNGGYPVSNLTTASTGVLDLLAANGGWLQLCFHRIIPDVVSAVVTGTTAVVTFAAAHPFGTGDTLFLAGFTPAGLNGSFTVTSKTSTTATVSGIPGGTTNATVQGTATASTTDCDKAGFVAVIDAINAKGIPVLPVGDVLRYAAPGTTSGVTISTATPQPGAIVPAAGSAGQVSDAGHIHGRSWAAPEDWGLLGFAYPPDGFTQASPTPTAGVAQVAKVRVAKTTTIANIHLYVSTAGSGLTAGQCFASLHSPTKVLLGTTADQAAAWASTGNKTMGLTAQSAGSLTSLPPGDYYVAWWSNGTTPPQMARAGGIALVNVNLSAANSRYSTADTGLTTTAPNPLGTMTALSVACWAGVS